MNSIQAPMKPVGDFLQILEGLYEMIVGVHDLSTRNL